MKRIAITGSSGYLGRLLSETWTEQGLSVLGVDVRPPAGSGSGSGEFCQMDIADPDLETVLADFQPDTLVHGAYIVQPIHDRCELERVNLEGSRNLLRSAATVCPERLLLVSSATAYGALPDNPVPMNEECPLRAGEAFPYAAHKVQVDSLFQKFAADHPKIAVSRVRPSIVSGPRMDNFLHRYFFRVHSLVKLDGHDQPLQFVHEEDVVGAIDAILTAGRGAFNVAPEDPVTISEIARTSGRPVISIPMGFARLVYRIGWALRLPRPEAPPGFLDFARYPWIVGSARLRDEIGFAFRHSSKEALEAASRNGGAAG